MNCDNLDALFCDDVIKNTVWACKNFPDGWVAKFRRYPAQMRKLRKQFYRCIYFLNVGFCCFF